MKNSEQPAFPTMGHDTDGDKVRYPGVNKREYFVGQILAGYHISGYNLAEGYEVAPRIAKNAILIADEILKQLED